MEETVGVGSTPVCVCVCVCVCACVRVCVCVCVFLIEIIWSCDRTRTAWAQETALFPRMPLCFLRSILNGFWVSSAGLGGGELGRGLGNWGGGGVGSLTLQILSHHEEKDKRIIISAIFTLIVFFSRPPPGAKWLSGIKPPALTRQPAAALTRFWGSVPCRCPSPPLIPPGVYLVAACGRQGCLIAWVMILLCVCVCVCVCSSTNDTIGFLACQDHRGFASLCHTVSYTRTLASILDTLTHAHTDTHTHRGQFKDPLFMCICVCNRRAITGFSTGHIV